MRLAVVALLATGCYTEMNSSSRQYLSERHSGIATRHDVAATVAEVKQLLGGRGFEVVDEHPGLIDGETVLELHGEREPAEQVGTELVVWVAPGPRDITRVSIVGIPTHEGHPVCTPRAWVACEKMHARSGSQLESLLDAKAEVKLVQDLLVELARVDAASAPARPSP